MNHNPLSGTGKVFCFSFKQTCLSKGWLISTVVIAALLLIGIPLIFLGITAAASDENEDDSDQIRTVFVVDETAGEADYSVISEKITFTAFAAMDEAVDAAASASGEDAANTVILRVTKPDETYLLSVYLPENTNISRSRASSFADESAGMFSAVLLQKAELSAEEAMLLSMPVTAETVALSPDNEAESDDTDMMAEILGFILPFFMMMLVYMMVVFYGQSMANSVMLEKTSKLMETILTAVHPFALMAGKLFATACAAVLQILTWLFCGIAGSVAGAMFASSMIPDTDTEAVVIINQIMDSSSLFSLSGLPLGLLILALGFLLYLSLSSVAGALASKTEDLNKTNIVFVLVLVFSMLMCIGSPSDAADDLTMISSATWLRYFPFTALLINPGELVLGKLSLLTGCISALILAVTVILVVLAAAVIYRMLVLYRGNPPTPKKLIEMLRQQSREK